jgi:hypothetical protein
MLVDQANSRKEPHNFFPESHIQALNQIATELKGKNKEPEKVVIPMRRKSIKEVNLFDFLE